jgi:cupin 2 domain-containing protein
VKRGNLFSGIAPAKADGAEDILRLAEGEGVRIVRIVSHGQASPPDFWYDQEWNEWVVVLSGSAAVLIEGDAEPVTLRAGDHLTIPAHKRHRVAWTDASEPTVWLAVHYT